MIGDDHLAMGRFVCLGAVLQLRYTHSSNVAPVTRPCATSMSVIPLVLYQGVDMHAQRAPKVHVPQVGQVAPWLSGTTLASQAGRPGFDSQ